jgi:T5SS/PEP-CTERM-associated repeat protein/autotransporter-associated beta strand protein
MKNILMSCALLIALSASIARAAFTVSGQVTPADPSTWTGSTTGYIGKTAAGELTVNGGSDLLSSYTYLGHDNGSAGTAAVDGAGSTWTNTYVLFIGRYGSGNLNVINGGTVGSFEVYVGDFEDSTGTVTMNGSGSTCNSSWLYVGMEGTGSFTQNDGTNAVANSLALGAMTKAANFLAGVHDLDKTSTGDGTYNLNGGTLILKSLYKGEGKATFNFGGGTLKAGGAFSCSLPLTLTGVHGNSKIDTAGYDLTLSGGLSGNGGLFKFGAGSLNLTGANAYAGTTRVNAGTLNISGGSISDAAGTVAYDAGSTGTMSVSGAGSKWLNTYTLIVGNSGSGSLNVTSGGSVSNAAGYVGYNSGSTGTVSVSGSNSKWTNSSNLYVGYDGTGTVVQTGGTVSVAGDLILGAHSIGSGAYLLSGGLLNMNGGTITISSGSGLYTSSGILQNVGQIQNNSDFYVTEGIKQIGPITGTGNTLVFDNAQLTTASISQNALSIGDSKLTAVPEPSSLALLGIAALGLLAYATEIIQRKKGTDKGVIADYGELENR